MIGESVPRIDTTCLLVRATFVAWLLLATSPVLGQRYSASGNTETAQPPAAEPGVPGAPPSRAAVFDPPGYRAIQDTSPLGSGISDSQGVASPARDSQLIEGGKILARINGELVLAGEILPQVEGFLRQNRNQIPDSQLAAVKRQGMETALRQLIDTKLLYSEFRRKVPEEGLQEIEKRIVEQFDLKVLPRLIEREEVAGRIELDAKMRATGSSLESRKQAYIEGTLAQQWHRQSINRDPEISRAELLAHYEERLKEYEFEARARWEEITVRFDRFATRDEAQRRLCEIGNDVMAGRIAFADAARQHSHGFTSAQGGQHDWTTQGALVAKNIDEALFSPSLTVGAMSPILESDSGYHIVRVVQRQDAGRTPFVEAQVEIREELRKEKVEEESKAYLADLRKNARVWTIFNNEPPANISRANDGGMLR
jgi:parvulin-like peptidyl-prolyl isomerase